jgi:hypothetical protein
MEIRLVFEAEKHHSVKYVAEGAAINAVYVNKDQMRSELEGKKGWPSAIVLNVTFETA